MRKNKKSTLEAIICIVCISVIFAGIGSKMGCINMVNTIMQTAFSLLTDTVLYIMAIAVVVGGFAGIVTEFGVINLIDRILSPLMKPLYGLPGAGIVGVLTTFLSDNPAILTLANDGNFKRHFKKYQLPALTNIGTAFGMGLIIITFMISATASSGENFLIPALIGLFGAVIGSIVSTRLMLLKTKKVFGTEDLAIMQTEMNSLAVLPNGGKVVARKSIGERALTGALDGGKSGVSVGIAIIPGVLIICTMVLLLTNGPSEDGGYTGAAYEGIALLPYLAEKINFILTPLFGFTSSECIAVPITSLGASGAAIGLVPGLVSSGLAGGNDIAVFTAMCMCWSGYLSTHVAMMDSLNFRELTGHAILSHTIGGLCAGVGAHWVYVLYSVV